MDQLPELTDEEWRELHDRLTVYADKKARKLYWRGLPGGPNQTMPQGHGPDSLAAEAIVDVLTGQRQCNATDRQGLLRFLMGVIDSKISHLVNRVENRKTSGDADVHDGAMSGKSAPQDELEGSMGASFRLQVAAALEGEPRLQELFDCLAADITSRRDIAEIMGITVTEVTNLKKQLARRLDALRPRTRKASRART